MEKLRVYCFVLYRGIVVVEIRLPFIQLIDGWAGPYLLLLDPTSDVHVLDHQVRRAEVYEAEEGVVVFKLQMAEHLCKLKISIIFVNHVSIGLDDLEAVNELLLSILRNHILLELGKLTPRNIYHVLIIVAYWLLRESVRLGILFLRLGVLILVVSVLVLSYRGLLRERPLGMGDQLRRDRGRSIRLLVIRLVEVVDVVHEHLVEQFLVLPVFGLIIVQLQFCQSLLRSLGLQFGHLGLLLLFLLLLRLYGFEFIEHVLIMQDSM